MIDVIESAIALGLDGFVACAGLGVLLPKKSARVPLALAFGVCDALASALGSSFGVRGASASLFGALSLLALCAAVGAAGFALVATAPPRRRSGVQRWFALPLLMSLDNLVLGTPASTQALVSNALVVAATAAALAFSGLKLGAWVSDLRWVRAQGSAS